MSTAHLPMHASNKSQKKLAKQVVADLLSARLAPKTDADSIWLIHNLRDLYGLDLLDKIRQQRPQQWAKVAAAQSSHNAAQQAKKPAQTKASTRSSSAPASTGAAQKKVNTVVPKAQSAPKSNGNSKAALTATGVMPSTGALASDLRDQDDQSSSSTISSESEASDVVAGFLDSIRAGHADKTEKLRLWQSLCVELGLAKPIGDDASSRLSDSGVLLSTESGCRSSGSSASSPLGSPPVFVSTRFSDSDSTGHSEHSESLTMLSRMRSLSMSSSSSTESASSDATETEPIKEVPQTLTACKKLLKEKGHVNLVDYLDVCRPLRTEAEFSELRCLVFSSAAEMMRYTRKERKFIPRQLAKQEALQPLLKTFNRPKQ